MKCAKCGYENDSYQTVCVNCGNPLTEGFVMCPNCGKIIRDNTLVCPRCKEDIFLKSVTNPNGIIENVAYTPKYIIKSPMSLILSIYLFISSLIKFIYHINEYLEEDISLIENIVSNNYYLLSSFIVLIVSLVALIIRLTMNIKTDTESLNKRLVDLKTFVIASSLMFLTECICDSWYLIFSDEEGLSFIYKLIIIGIPLIPLFMLPIFYNKSQVTSR